MIATPYYLKNGVRTLDQNELTCHLFIELTDLRTPEEIEEGSNEIKYSIKFVGNQAGINFMGIGNNMLNECDGIFNIPLGIIEDRFNVVNKNEPIGGGKPKSKKNKTRKIIRRKTKKSLKSKKSLKTKKIIKKAKSVKKSNKKT